MGEDTNAYNITVYISEGCPICEQVTDQLKKWNVPFEIKNVTKDKEAMNEMQSKGIYGTPVTIHKKWNKRVLGFNETDLQRLIKSEKTLSNKNALSFLLY